MKHYVITKPRLSHLPKYCSRGGQEKPESARVGAIVHAREFKVLWGNFSWLHWSRGRGIGDALGERFDWASYEDLSLRWVMEVELVPVWCFEVKSFRER